MIRFRLDIGRAIVSIRLDRLSLAEFVGQALADLHCRPDDSDGSSYRPTPLLIEDRLPRNLRHAPPPDRFLQIAIREHAALPHSSAYQPALEDRLFGFESGVSYYYRPSQAEYRIAIRDTAQGKIDFKSGTVAWDVAGSLLPRAALHILLLDPLSLLLPEHGLMICHGAALCDDQGACLIFGNSGAGKSTLSTLLSQGTNPQATWLSDDTFLLDFTQDPITVSPIHTGFGLQPWLIRHFALAEEEENILQRSQGKIYFHRVSGQAFGSHPVQHIIFLDKTAHQCSSEKDTLKSRKALGKALGKEGPEMDEPEMAQGSVEKTQGQWLTPGQTLHALLSSQSVIPHPSLTERIFLWQRLSRQASAARLTYQNLCEPDAILSVMKAFA